MFQPPASRTAIRHRPRSIVVMNEVHPSAPPRGSECNDEERLPGYAWGNMHKLKLTLGRLQGSQRKLKLRLFICRTNATKKLKSISTAFGLVLCRHAKPSLLGRIAPWFNPPHHPRTHSILACREPSSFFLPTSPLCYIDILFIYIQFWRLSRTLYAPEINKYPPLGLGTRKAYIFCHFR